MTFLVGMAQSGVSFADVATVGRQSYYLNARELEAVFRRFDEELAPGEAASLIDCNGGFAEPLLHRLGARTVTSIDASDYERCSLVHDMNRPVPDSLHERFTTVLDGGSLEHVYAFPQAIENCMRLVKEDGHLLIITPANNELGHGFYQFSPELFFRLLDPQNGFETEAMYLAETGWRTRWFEVTDPAAAGQRARVHNHGSTYLFIRARRVGAVPNDLATPQQSDYERMWNNAEERRPVPGTRRRSTRAWMLRCVPAGLRRRAQRAAMGVKSRYDPSCFRPIEASSIASRTST